MRSNVVRLSVICSVMAVWGATPAAAQDELKLPSGFTATVIHEGLGAGRHLAVAANGDVYLASRNGLVALRDSDGDGKLDQTAPFGDVKGTGVQIHGDWLYASDNVGVYRYALKKGNSRPVAAARPWCPGSRWNVSMPTRPLRWMTRALSM